MSSSGNARGTLQIAMSLFCCSLDSAGFRNPVVAAPRGLVPKLPADALRRLTSGLLQSSEAGQLNTVAAAIEALRQLREFNRELQRVTQGIEFLETIYGQLREAGIVRSKGEFSERLLGKSPSYLTSMRGKQRAVSNEVIIGLGDAIYSEIKGLHGDESGAVTALRRAMAQINIYLAEQTSPRSPVKQPAQVAAGTQTIAPEPFDLIAAIRWLAGLDPRNA